MPLFCDDGERGAFVKRGPKPEAQRGEPWRPPDLSPDRCQREACRKLAMDHTTLRPEEL